MITASEKPDTKSPSVECGVEVMHRFAVQQQLFPLDPLPMDTGGANTFGTDSNNVAVWKRAVWKRTVDAASLLVDERGLERDSGNLQASAIQRFCDPQRPHVKNRKETDREANRDSEHSKGAAAYHDLQHAEGQLVNHCRSKSVKNTHEFLYMASQACDVGADTRLPTRDKETKASSCLLDRSVQTTQSEFLPSSCLWDHSLGPGPLGSAVGGLLDRSVRVVGG